MMGMATNEEPETTIGLLHQPHTHTHTHTHTRYVRVKRSIVTTEGGEDKSRYVYTGTK